MKLLRIGITHGDINGIGYELLLKVLQDPELLDICNPVIFGSLPIAQATAHQIGIEQVPFYITPNAEEALDGRINLIPVLADEEAELQFGEQTEAALKAEANSLTAALDAFHQHLIDALVTLPGHLDNDRESHALSDFIRRALGSQEESFDWTLNGGLRLLRLHHMDVSTQLGEGLASEAFVAHIQSIHRSLRQDFDMIRPRIAVISAQQKLKGDLDDLREQGITVFGPFAADDFVKGQWQHHYDGCLFLGEDESHDQVLAAEDSQFTIGYVSGLPLVLTYPLQGISYDIAGQGKADEVPLRQAIYAAIDIVRSRVRYHHATHHPLEKQWVPRGRDDFKLDLTKEE